MRTRTTLLVWVLGSAGCHNCGDHDPKGAETDTDPFAGSETCGFICVDDTTGAPAATATIGDDSAAAGSSSTGAVGPVDECQASDECGGGLFCVAPFDQTLGPKGKGLYACVDACVPLVDEDLWCADATACCDPDATCTDRGYCELPGASTGTDSGTGGSDTGDSGSGDGTGTSGGGGSSTGGTAEG